MRANLGVLRDVVRTKRQHLSTCYDHGYLDHQWGYTRRDRSRLTEPQQGAYQAGWRAADEDGTADCFVRPLASCCGTMARTGQWERRSAAAQRAGGLSGR